VVPVLDLRWRFELAEAPVRADRKIVVFEGPDGWVAAVVDSVREVNAVDPALVAPPPPLFRGLAREYLVGVLQDGDRLVMVLDAARLLSSTERLELEWATTGLTLGE
jgi:purine-binding chemotaxis protein CheW